jgi:LPXTG-motif cell wall-anchored protein
VPGPGLPWLLAGGALLLGLGGFALRRRRQAPLAVLLLVGIAAIPIAAWAAVTLPYSFTDGTTADADEVNANFAALVAAVEANQARLDAIDEMFLTTDACPLRYTAVEDGYVRLGGTGLTVVPQARTLETPGHYHGTGTLATDMEGAHRHTFYDYHYLDQGADPNYATGSGDDAALAVTGHLEHVLLRLCVES